MIPYDTSSFNNYGIGILNTIPYNYTITTTSSLLWNNTVQKEDSNELKINIKKTPIKFNFNL